jgi:hypothetical protein
VTSPLNKILSKPRSNRFGGDGLGHDAVDSTAVRYQNSVFGSPDSGLYQQRSNFPTEESSPNADELFQMNR